MCTNFDKYFEINMHRVKYCTRRVHDCKYMSFETCKSKTRVCKTVILLFRCKNNGTHDTGAAWNGATFFSMTQLLGVPRPIHLLLPNMAKNALFTLSEFSVSC